MEQLNAPLRLGQTEPSGIPPDMKRFQRWAKATFMRFFMKVSLGRADQHGYFRVKGIGVVGYDGPE
jgi:hypothetical protein